MRNMTVRTTMKAIVLAAVCLCLTGTGCGSKQKAPQADPNFKPTTDPSAITVPSQMKPPAGAGAPGTTR